MGDNSWMTITVSRCPNRRRKVTRLLAEYRLLDGEQETVVDGEPYNVEQISLGSVAELAGRLIATAPKCAFTVRQDPYADSCGDLVSYTPALGRFDADVDGSGNVIINYQQATSLITEGITLYLQDEDAASGDSGYLFGAPQEAVGAVTDVAFGRPWLAPDTATDVLRERWLAVIDARWMQKRERVQQELADGAAKLKAAGLDACASAILTAPPEQQGELAREAAVEAESVLRHAARVSGFTDYWALPYGSLPSDLRRWADTWETTWQGRRRRDKAKGTRGGAALI